MLSFSPTKTLIKSTTRWKFYSAYFPLQPSPQTLMSCRIAKTREERKGKKQRLCKATDLENLRTDSRRKASATRTLRGRRDTYFQQLLKNR